MKILSKSFLLPSCFLQMCALTGFMTMVAQAQITYAPVFTNFWAVAAGTFADLPADANNNVRGAAISPLTTNVLFASTASGTNNSVNHVATLAFADGSNYLAGLNGFLVYGGTLALTKVRVADDGTVYACNLSGGAVSEFRLYKWPSDTDTSAEPVTVFDTGTGNSFPWRLGDYMDLRGSGSNTEIVVVGNGNSTAITTNFVIFRPTDETCTTFTNFSITIPGSSGSVNLCGAGVTFEGTNNAIWIRRSGSSETRHIVYDPATLTATCDRTNTVDTTADVGIKYYRANGIELLAMVQASSTAGATHYARVFQIPPSPTGPLISVLSSNLLASSGRNGNALGNVDARSGYFVFGAPGYGLSFFGVRFLSNSPPTVSITSSGATLIQGYPVTFTGTATGSTPLHYQWYFSNGMVTNPITGAATNFYTITSSQPADAGSYYLTVTNAYGKATSGLATITVLPNGSSPLFTNLWSLAPGSRSYLTTTDTQRGLAYDPVTQRLVLVTRAPTNGIILLDANSGADAGNLDISQILALGTGAPGIYSINMCGVADDGAVYVGNLLTSATSDDFSIYRWTSADPSATISQAYLGNPGIGRIGDTMAARGAGSGTEIVCPFRTGTNVALFNTYDGMNFNINIIAITNLPAAAQANGFAGLGIAFGPGNSFWAKSAGFDLRQVAFDVSSGIGTVINDYPNLPVTEAALGVDNANGYVAIVAHGESPQNLAIYDLAASGGPSLSSLVDRESFPANNSNINGTGSVAVDAADGRLFALDSNNGIIALAYAGKLALLPLGNRQILTWSVTNSVLQSSANVAGPYSDISGAASPYTNSAGGTLFFRLRH